MTFNQGVRGSNPRWLTKRKSLGTLRFKGFYFIWEWQAIRQKIEAELNGNIFCSPNRIINES